MTALPEPPGHPTSWGIRLNCREAREFANSTEMDGWDYKVKETFSNSVEKFAPPNDPDELILQHRL